MHRAAGWTACRAFEHKSTTTSQAPELSNRQNRLGGVSRIPFVGPSYSAILCLLAE